jgi:hypothetical protein
LRDEAETNERSVGAEIRRALKQYLNAERPNPFRQVENEQLPAFKLIDECRDALTHAEDLLGLHGDDVDLTQLRLALHRTQLFVEAHAGKAS